MRRCIRTDSSSSSSSSGSALLPVLPVGSNSDVKMSVSSYRGKTDCYMLLLAFQAKKQATSHLHSDCKECMACCVALAVHTVCSRACCSKQATQTLKTDTDTHLESLTHSAAAGRPSGVRQAAFHVLQNHLQGNLCLGLVGGQESV